MERQPAWVLIVSCDFRYDLSAQRASWSNMATHQKFVFTYIYIGNLPRRIEDFPGSNA